MIIENNTCQADPIINVAKDLLNSAAQALDMPLNAVASTVKIGGDMTVPQKITAYQINFSTSQTLLLGVNDAGQLSSLDTLTTIIQKQTHVLKKDRHQFIGIELAGAAQQQVYAVYAHAAQAMELKLDTLVGQVGVFGLETLPGVVHKGCARNLPQGMSLVGADTADGYDCEASLHADQQILSLRQELLHSDVVDEYDERGLCGQRAMCLPLVAMHELVHAVQNKRASQGEKTLPLSDDLWRHVAGLQQMYFEEIHAVLASIHYYKKAQKRLALPALSPAVLLDEQQYIDKNRRAVSGLAPESVQAIIDEIKKSLTAKLLYD